MASRRDTLAELLRDMPVSIRELARASDLTHVALLRARDGHMRLSEAAVQRIIAVLREWSGSLTEFAERLEAATDEAAGRDPPRSGG
jgi:hypothetical protein